MAWILTNEIVQMRGSTPPMPNYKNGRLVEFEFFDLPPIVEVLIDLEWSGDENHYKSQQQFWIHIKIYSPHR